MYNLTFNGFTSNLAMSSVGANILVSNFNSTGISCIVTLGVCTQTFLVNAQPTLVNIDGTPVAIDNRWTYLNGTVTVTGAAKSVMINLT